MHSGPRQKASVDNGTRLENRLADSRNDATEDANHAAVASAD